MQIKIEKFQWSEDDFGKMGWHDNYLYAIAFDEENFKLTFDIDYILEWVHPIKDEIYFKFWVAPATLVFNQVQNLNINFEGSTLDIVIEDIQRVEVKNNEKVEYDWTIETRIGSISFKSIGFDQFIRGMPELISNQRIGLDNRGGVSFAETVP